MSDRIDIIEELKLRQWARQHYVPVALRDASWHPVILKEMQDRDAEHAHAAGPPLSAGLVPLMDTQRIRIDAPHGSASAVRQPRATLHPNQL